jgi:hypothetical protein
MMADLPVKLKSLIPGSSLISVFFISFIFI